ncbi:MAG: hypothetical protein ACK5DR_21785, partial [Planctomyces sp.]
MILHGLNLLVDQGLHRGVRHSLFQFFQLPDQNLSRVAGIAICRDVVTEGDTVTKNHPVAENVCVATLEHTIGGHTGKIEARGHFSPGVLFVQGRGCGLFFTEIIQIPGRQLDRLFAARVGNEESAAGPFQKAGLT